jgi:hypothetical protein
MWAARCKQPPRRSRRFARREDHTDGEIYVDHTDGEIYVDQTDGEIYVDHTDGEIYADRTEGPMRTARDGAEALREALRAEGGTVATVLGEPPGADERRLDHPGPAQLAAAGPRTRSREREYELLFEMILEGYRLHYDEPVVVRSQDADLKLLLGDQLYALGLSRLAQLGDLEAVGELADVISLAAQAHTAADPDLARTVWEAGAVSVGWGATEAHRRAKEPARAHEPDTSPALRAAAKACRDGSL